MPSSDDQTLALARDVVLTTGVPGGGHVLLRTSTGRVLDPPSGCHAAVAGFFCQARTVSAFRSAFTKIDGAMEALELLRAEHFVQPASDVSGSWLEPPAIDFALHAQAGWSRDAAAVGRDIYSRLADEPARTRDWRHHPVVPLPPRARVALPLEQTLRRRRTHRSFGKSTLDGGQLATLLGHAAGVQGLLPAEPFRDVQVRPYPSGGARHPLEFYVVARTSAPDLPSGVHHWNAETGTLRSLAPAPPESVLRRRFEDRTYYLGASVWVLVSSIWQRRAFKYECNIMRNILLETGAVMQNLLLVATAMGLVGCPFDVRREPLEDLLGLDPLQEPLMLGVAFGYAADAVVSQEVEVMGEEVDPSETE